MQHLFRKNVANMGGTSQVGTNEIFWIDRSDLLDGFRLSGVL